MTKAAITNGQPNLHSNDRSPVSAAIDIYSLGGRGREGSAAAKRAHFHRAASIQTSTHGELQAAGLLLPWNHGMSLVFRLRTTSRQGVYLQNMEKQFQSSSGISRQY